MVWVSNSDVENKMEAVVEKRVNLGLVIFLGLNVADCVVTYIVLSMGGVENSWYKFILGSVPVWGMLLLKMLLVGLIAMVVYRYKKKLFKPLNVGMGLIVAANLLPIIAYWMGRLGF